MVPTLSSTQLNHFNQGDSLSELSEREQFDIIFSIKTDLELLEEDELKLFTPEIWQILFHYYIDESHKILHTLDQTLHNKINQLAHTVGKAAINAFCAPSRLNMALNHALIERIEQIRHRISGTTAPEESWLITHWASIISIIGGLIIFNIFSYLSLVFLTVSVLCAVVSSLLFCIGFLTKLTSLIFFNNQTVSNLSPEIKQFADQLTITSGILDRRYQGTKKHPKAGFTLFKAVIETYLENLITYQKTQ